MHFAAFDVTTDDRTQLQQLLRAWSEAAARMCEGKPVGEGPLHPSLPPDDTGEALSHPPSRLTLTIGFGPTLFERDGVDRFGLAGQRPNQLADIPAMPGDELDTGRSGGDLCIQACADDSQVAFHAVRNMVRVANGVAQLRWWQEGFNRASSTSTSQETPRNLHGFKDGTNNLRADDEALIDRHVWVQPADGAAWMRGGTYLVARRIGMHIEEWDNSSLDDQEKAIGRHKGSGAPIGSPHEHAPLDLEARGEDGGPLIPTNAHVRLSRGEEQILRRSYSYMDGMDKAGKLDAGLFFICFQRDPLRQFVPKCGSGCWCASTSSRASRRSSAIWRPWARRWGRWRPSCAVCGLPKPTRCRCTQRSEGQRADDTPRSPERTGSWARSRELGFHNRARACQSLRTHPPRVRLRPG